MPRHLAPSGAIYSHSSLLVTASSLVLVCQLFSLPPLLSIVWKRSFNRQDWLTIDVLDLENGILKMSRNQVVLIDWPMTVDPVLSLICRSFPSWNLFQSSHAGLTFLICISVPAGSSDELINWFILMLMRRIGPITNDSFPNKSWNNKYLVFLLLSFFFLSFFYSFSSNNYYNT